MKDKKTIKNVAASIRQRLYNRARDRGEDFNLILSRYAVERFLQRLSQSPYAGKFILKGAQLFSLWSEMPHRITRDLDLLGKGESAIAELEALFRVVCKQPVDFPDGIEFAADTVKGEEIREQAKYKGVRIRLMYVLAEAKDILQIDIGFGDIVTPRAKFVEFPSLLEFLPVRLKAYSRETVIAEKFQALVMLGIGNSRMKDFYDLFILSGAFHFDGAVLSPAIAATFRRRKTTMPQEIPLALTNEFAHNAAKQKQWHGFLNKNGLQPAQVHLAAVIEKLREFLIPPTTAFAKEKTFKQIWPPGGPWRKK